MSRWRDSSLPLPSRVLLFVCDHHPLPVSRYEIATTMGVGSRRVGDALRVLVEAGWLERRKVSVQVSSNGTFLYRVSEPKRRAA